MDNEKVSYQWYALLIDIRKNDKVWFHVNEGRRTKARQLELIREKGIYNSVTNPYGAAPYSPQAPHIRTGRFDHAIDFNNAQGVINAAKRRGVTLVRTVSTEEWHVEAVATQLQAYYEKRKRRLAGLQKRINNAKKKVTAWRKYLNKLRGQK